MARANLNYAPAGLEPPLSMAVRHRMGEVAKTLLSYLADVEARGHPAGADCEVGPTATELASEDGMLLQLLRAPTSWRTGLRNIEEPN